MFRRERQCSVCHWTGPRRRLMRWGTGHVCRNEEFCQRRHKLGQAVVVEFTATQIREQMTAELQRRLASYRKVS